MTCTHVPITLLSIEREAAACIKYLPLAVVLLCKARLLGGVGLLQPWLASRKLRAPLHTQRRASGPSARDPGPYTPDTTYVLQPLPSFVIRSMINHVVAKSRARVLYFHGYRYTYTVILILARYAGAYLYIDYYLLEQ